MLSRRRGAHDGCVSVPRGRRLLLSTAAALVLALLATLGGALLGGDEVTAPDAAPSEPVGPVLLVPGYGGATAGLQVLADALRATGRQAVVVGLPGNGTGDLREAAAVLRTAVDDAVAAGAPSVDVVGFSAGGVVARLAARDGAAGLRRVVTLGSPHHGTSLAALGAALAPERCPLGCRQLAPGSPLLRALNAGDETPEGPDWVSVWTARDEVVTPPESARLEGAVNVVVQDVCAGAPVDHSGLVRSPVVAALVADALRPGPVPTWGPEDCGRLPG